MDRKTNAETDKLLGLRNVGPAIRSDLADLGIHSVAELAKQDADELYVRLQRQLGRPVDPCVHDTFRAIVHEARTGEKTPWFAWTKERKGREAAGTFKLRFRDLKTSD